MYFGAYVVEDVLRECTVDAHLVHAQQFKRPTSFPRYGFVYLRGSVMGGKCGPLAYFSFLFNILRIAPCSFAVFL